jgi:[ribosomal protein S5]-alanine N-acetyltransferase
MEPVLKTGGQRCLVGSNPTPSAMQTLLRPIRLDDAGSLAAIVSASSEHLRPWEPRRSAEHYTEPGQRGLITRLLGTDTTVPFVIESPDGEILGRLTLSGVTRGALQSCAIGYWIRADRLRLGHATRAVRAGLDHAFGVLGLHRVQAETLPENTPSQRVLERVGFTRYGLAPEYLRIDGIWRDHVMFQALAPSES